MISAVKTNGIRALVTGGCTTTPCVRVSLQVIQKAFEKQDFTLDCTGHRALGDILISGSYIVLVSNDVVVGGILYLSIFIL